jgi:hypothetical protein
VWTQCHIKCYEGKQWSTGRVFFLLFGHSDRYRMVVGFTTSCTINAYHHYKCKRSNPSHGGRVRA